MIEVKKLNKTYNRRRLHANRVLRDVSFTLPDKGFVCILGPSGCGKTSLLNAIGGLDTFDNGTLSTENVSVSRYGTVAFENERNRSFGYIFQNYYLLDNHSVAYNVYLGLHSLKLSHKEKLERIKQALEAVDMLRYAKRKVCVLSGGQQQRVAIARALARRPKVIFADEPTGNLDEANTQNICTLLRQASKDSLVLMVTHEDRIARFFADRIITLEKGVLVDDTQEWDREQLVPNNDKEVYTGDFADSSTQGDLVTLRMLRSGKAAPLALTVIATEDRVILKVSDKRAILLSQEEESPKLIEGKRPVLKLENIEGSKDTHIALFREPPAAQTKAGKGVTASMQLQEARSLMQGKGIRSLAMRIFLVLLTVLTLITVADYIAISQIRPEDYVTSDSHHLQISTRRGSNATEDEVTSGALVGMQRKYNAWIQSQIPGCQVIASLANVPQFSVMTFPQLDRVTLTLPSHSIMPIDILDESSLLYGRMPEHSGEIVVDRLLLEAVMKKDSIMKNVITSIETALNCALVYGNEPLRPVIVGISDNNECTVYMTQAAMLMLSLRGTEAIGLSEFKKLHPGQYDDLTLADMECFAILDNAGQIYSTRVGTITTLGANYSCNIKGVVDSDQTKAYFVVPDDMIYQLLKQTAIDELNLYCPDTEAAKQIIRQGSQWEEDGLLKVSVVDRYSNDYEQYLKETILRADARIIVTAAVMVICMVMLYLLCRAQIQHRLSLVAVYRLLGIPGGKLYGIFLMEGTLSALASIVPVGFLTWVVIAALQRFTELELRLELSLVVTGIVCACILVYYLIVSLIPLGKLLRLPPARLAAQYDV